MMSKMTNTFYKIYQTFISLGELLPEGYVDKDLCDILHQKCRSMVDYVQT